MEISISDAPFRFLFLIASRQFSKTFTPKVQWRCETGQWRAVLRRVEISGFHTCFA